MQAETIVVLITAPSREVAEKIARVLLEGRLVACVNIVAAIDSFFWWQGAIQSEQEVLLIAKSRADLFAEGIVPAVRANHPYDVPEIIALPILMGSQAYLDWIKEETVSGL
jgi:periplasmic divalent cation tolerance protein